jgi:peptidoglycan/xylan/chitin deacetylase (PgdA/CDA1 family)
VVLGEFKKHWGPKICSWFPLDFWHRLLKLELVLPYYHVISDQGLAHISGLFKFRNVSQFKTDLEFFLRFYTPVSIEDIVRHLDGNHQLPHRCFLLSFDDGFRENYDVVAPILQEQGVPAVFFLTTSVLDNHELCYPQKKSLLIRATVSLGDSASVREALRRLNGKGVKGPDLASCIRNITYRQRHILDEVEALLRCDFAGYAASVQPYLTSEQVRSLIKKGFTIGAHSIDHPPYSELTLEEQLIQTRESINWLSSRFQYECQTFAFPHRDTGVLPEFFQTTFADGRLKVSFGASGIYRHFFRRNLERFTMEKTDLKAAQILAREFGVNVLRGLLR